jgi:4-hydroxybenzoate polyprenyltransferase
MPQSSDIPLCVDLDGTLVRTDLLWESFLILIKSKPWLVLIVPFLLLKGVAALKNWIALQVEVDVSLLPYHQPFLNYLKQQKRPLILATGTHEKFARQIANHLGFFHDTLASTKHLNLTGRKKLKVILEKHGNNFAYAGNAAVDCKIWDKANEVIMVNAPSHLQKRYQSPMVFDDRVNSLKSLLRAIRLHQWAKNLLIFIPLLMSHNFLNSMYLLKSLWAFLAFSLCASSVYLINDLLDLESDRHHSRKKKRPFANGDLTIPKGIITIPIFMVISGWLAWQLPISFQIILIFYLVMTTGYSFFLKSIALVDVIILGSLYTIRIIAGGEATGILNTNWLLAFSFFLFVSLAFVKRFSELKSSDSKENVKVKGRGYFIDDLEQIGLFGTVSGYLSILVLALYLNSDHAHELYANSQILWLLCPIFLYWICRIWLLARRGHLIEDPVRFAITDLTTYIVLIIILFIFIFAKIPVEAIILK